MPFPDIPKEVYSKNVLKEVICQLRFPSILRITSELPTAFQERIRDQYPLYERETPAISLPKEVSQMVGNLPLLQGLEEPTHKFATKDKTRFVSINQNFLALSEKNYIRWSDFRDALHEVEEPFRGIYVPPFYERIGLRYQNAIDRNHLGLQHDDWGTLLNRSLLGFLGSGEIYNDIKDIRNQTLMSLGQDTNGYVRITHGLAGGDRAGSVYIIDADFFSEERTELEDAFKILDHFNTCAFRFFRWFITDKLREALGPIASE